MENSGYDLLPKSIPKKEYDTLLSLIEKHVGLDNVEVLYELDNKRKMNVERSEASDPTTTIYYECLGDKPALNLNGLFKDEGLKELSLIYLINGNIVGYNIYLEDREIAAGKSEGITKKIHETLDFIVKSMKDAGFPDWKLDIPKDIKYHKDDSEDEDSYLSQKEKRAVKQVKHTLGRGPHTPKELIKPSFDSKSPLAKN